jgi:hypothetical protein
VAAATTLNVGRRRVSQGRVDGVVAVAAAGHQADRASERTSNVLLGGSIGIILI